MFSKSSIQKISPYIPGQAKLPGMDKVIRLASNENPYGCSDNVYRAFKSFPQDLNRYPNPDATTLKETLVKTYGLKIQNIICGNGSDELIALIAKTFAGKGDHILMAQYGFAMYKIAALATEAEPKEIPAKSHYGVDIQSILDHVTPKTKIIFIANPNNPTGSLLSKSDLYELRQLLREDILLVIDSAYAEYIEEQDYTAGQDMVEAFPNVLMLRTFSKIYGLAGLRIGWAYGDGQLIDFLNRIRPPFNVNMIGQKMAEKALEDQFFVKQSVQKNNEARAYFKSKMQELDIQTYGEAGNFYLLDFSNHKVNSDQVNEWLNRKAVLVRPLKNYLLNNHLRVTMGTEEETHILAEYIEQIVRGI